MVKYRKCRALLAADDLRWVADAARRTNQREQRTDEAWILEVNYHDISEMSGMMPEAEARTRRRGRGDAEAEADAGSRRG
jgi:hypothetical protein